MSRLGAKWLPAVFLSAGLAIAAVSCTDENTTLFISRQRCLDRTRVCRPW